MISFVIYEDEEKFRDKYFSIIDKFIGKSNIAYEIVEMKDYSPKELKKLENLSGPRIYILDIEVPGKSGLDYAREIRNSGDWTSQIIIVTSHENLKNFDYQSKMLMLAFISKFYDLESILFETIQIAHRILTTKETVEFKNGKQIHKVLKEDILFIEKDYNDSLCFVVTKENRILSNKTLIQWEKELKSDPRFVKTFRTFIVNTYNIRTIDFEKNELYFENNKVALLSRNFKKELTERIQIKK